MVNESRLLETFFDLVKTDSLSFHEAGVADMAIKMLAAMGVEASTDGAGDNLGGDSGNVIARIPGKGTRGIIFSAHLDTVDPGTGIEPLVADGIIVSSGPTILGADDKAGVAVILEAVRVLKEQHLEHAPIQLIFTVAEEKGLLGAKELRREQIAAELAFVFDSAGPVGHVTVRAPYQDSIEAVFHGKATHAGVDPEKGANAIVAAANALSAMPLGRISFDTTANVGVIHGGRAANIIADRVEIKGEARSLREEELIRQTASMIEIMNREAGAAGCRVETDVRREYDGFNLKLDDEVVTIVTAAADQAGVRAVLESTGGGADTNVFNTLGLQAVGLGVGYTNPHSEEETLPVADLVNAARLAVVIATASVKD